jgi:hypothetical protein
MTETCGWDLPESAREVPPQSPPVLACTVSITPRSDPEGNQDAHATAQDTAFGVGSVAVADGVGSLPDSGRAAALAVEHVVHDWSDNAPLVDPFREAHEAIRTELNGRGQTTLIDLQHRHGRTRIRWVGNGCVLRARLAPETRPGCAGTRVPGHRDTGRAPRVVWTDLLLPHVAFADGQDQLTQALGGRFDAPDHLMVWPGRHDEVLLAATDGLYSCEQATLGRDDDNGLWQQQPPQLQALLALAGHLLTRPWSAQCHCAAATGCSADPECTDLAAYCRRVLDNLLHEGFLDDDATLGVLLVPGRTGAPRDGTAS